MITLLCLLASTAFAQASPALFSFKTTSLPADDQGWLRAFLEQGRYSFPSDGTVVEPGGDSLTESESREILDQIKGHSAASLETNDSAAVGRRFADFSGAQEALSSDGALWDGGGAKQTPPMAAAVSRTAVDAQGHAVIHLKAQQPKKGPIGSKKWNPIWWLKNDDDYIVPKEYMPKSKPWVRKVYWFFRNPTHNFDFYVLGLNGSDRTVVTRRPDGLDGKNGWDWSVARRDRGFMRFPFVAYSHTFNKRRFNFYLGWRGGGAFGAKLNLEKLDHPKPARKKDAVSTKTNL